MNVWHHISYTQLSKVELIVNSFYEHMCIFNICTGVYIYIYYISHESGV